MCVIIAIAVGSDALDKALFFDRFVELAGISAIYYQSIEAGRRPNVSINIIGKIS
jgi:hypothetical protein